MSPKVYDMAQSINFGVTSQDSELEEKQSHQWLEWILIWSQLNLGNAWQMDKNTHDIRKTVNATGVQIIGKHAVVYQVGGNEIGEPLLWPTEARSPSH